MTMKLLAFTASLLLAGAAAAQTFPSKPVRVVVPLPPGPLDGTMRMFSPLIQEDLGQPVLIENRPGAAGVIGLEAVARAAPDGYTILGAAGGNFIVAPIVVDKHPTHPLRDFAPITILYDAPQAMVVKRTLPVNTLAEFIDYAKKNPGKLSYGSSGTGGAAHIEGENFKRLTGTNVLHVPYKGYGPMVQAMLGEEIDTLFSSPSTTSAPPTSRTSPTSRTRCPGSSRRLSTWAFLRRQERRARW
jgi:tripartite-type tricarboxylate transporter receptor subunit TctC